jgi:hypothetical protein
MAGEGKWMPTSVDGRSTRIRLPAAQIASEFLETHPRETKGRRECRALDAPAASRANEKHTSVVTTVTPESPGIPRAMVLTVSFVISPVNRAFLPPSPAGHFLQA